MAAPRFLRMVSNRIKEIVAAVVATADSIVATDSSGKLDISFMPTGVGAETVVCTAFEALTAGDFINLFLSGGVIQARKADATTNAKEAHGFVLANVLITASATVYLISNNNSALSGLTIGTDYYLHTTPGAVTVTAPSASGNIVQKLGRATSATTLPFCPNDTIEIA